jgi:hypothetical protein
MKQAIAVLCLLGALSANAQPACKDSFPIECQYLCTDLRRGAINASSLQWPLRDWILGDPDGGGCETDVRWFHNDAAVCADARTQIYTRAHALWCMHSPIECYRQIAQCMMDDPEGWADCF